MNWWSDFADQVTCDAPLGTSTWFRLGGKARYLFQPHDADQLASFLRRAADENVGVKVLGRGANVLVSDDGFDGVVVRLDSDEFRRERRRGERLEVGAGVDLMPLVRRCSREGLSGLEGLAGIPATVGGAIRMNAGGPAAEMGDVVEEVSVLTSDKEVELRSAEQIGFGYRHTKLDSAEIVLGAILKLNEDDPRKVRSVFREHLERKQRTQPLAEHSAGCIFKNPALKPAGALIDQAGLKGSRIGAAEVSSLHANFIVARSGATASDVLRLIDYVRERVLRLFDTELETEIEIWRPRGNAA
jgi:UDP-N-acetylmuramate dehydrogenase